MFESPEIESVVNSSHLLTARRQKLVNDLRQHLWRGSAGADRPMRVVIVGPTGSGKSTLLNGLVGRLVTRTGSVRPTTTLPLAYVHGRYASQMADDPIGYEVVPGEAPILDDLCLVDTPDIDSTNLANHQLADTALDSADVVIFVASALRYADMVPWKILRRLESRGVPVIHVLNRVSPDAGGVLTDFRRLLRREEMSGEVIRVSEHRIGDQGVLPHASVRQLRRALLDRVHERAHESEMMMMASLDDLTSRVAAFLDELDADIESQAGLRRRLYLDLSLLDTSSLIGPIEDWSRQLHVDRRSNRVTGRWLRRHGLDHGVCERIGDQMRAELASCLENNLALFDLDDTGWLALDLREKRPETRKPIAEVLDAAVDRWFYRPGIEEGGDAQVGSYKRAQRALVSLRASQDGADSAQEPSLREMISDVVGELAGRPDKVDIAAARAARDAGREILEHISPSPALLNA